MFWLAAGAVPFVAEAAPRAAAHAAPAKAAAPAAAPQPPCVSSRTEPAAPGGVVYFRDCADTPDMVSLKGGSFRMGDTHGGGLSYEQPVHEVHIGPFALARYEATIGEWQECVAAHACADVVTDADRKRARNPVTGMTWDQAQDYVRWLSRRSGKEYRLPSEAEWEYAARAGGDTLFTWGDSSITACEYANVFDQIGARAFPDWDWAADCQDGYDTTAPVGTYPPNAWGFYDLLGNVWEWVADCWHGDYTGAPADGSAWMGEAECRKHVNRGGGWGNNPRSMRISARDGDVTSGHSNALGFRVARKIAGN